MDVSSPVRARLDPLQIAANDGLQKWADIEAGELFPHNNELATLIEKSSSNRYPRIGYGPGPMTKRANEVDNTEDGSPIGAVTLCCDGDRRTM